MSPQFYSPNQPNSLNAPGRDFDFERAQEEGVGDTLLVLQNMCSPAKFPKFQMKEDDFVDKYGADVVNEAKKKSSMLRQKHEDVDVGTFAAVAETVPLLGNTHSLFGKDKNGKPIEVAVYGTAPVEDYGFPKADLIFEIKNVFDDATVRKYNPKSTTRFVVDVTTAEDLDVKFKKERAETPFKSGKLHDIRFFKSVNPVALVGISNTPNLILPVTKEEIIFFLKGVRPFVDDRSKSITNKSGFESAYQNFAEVLRDKLIAQAIDQAKSFAIVCAARKIISNEDYEKVSDLIDSGKALDAYSYVGGVRLGVSVAPTSEVNMAEKANAEVYIRSLKTLIETVISLENIEKRKQKSTGFSFKQKVA